MIVQHNKEYVIPFSGGVQQVLVDNPDSDTVTLEIQPSGFNFLTYRTYTGSAVEVLHLNNCKVRVQLSGTAQVSVTGLSEIFIPEVPSLAKLTHSGEMYVLMLGASITNSLVDTETKRSTLETQLSSAGMRTRVFDKATGGDKSATLLAHIRDEGLLDPFLPYASKCQCMIHIGGNDVSSGPYPSEAALLDSNLREIAQWLEDRNFNFTISPISYRVPPASNPAEPYNTNIVEPIITEFCPGWVDNGSFLYNFHEYFENNQSIISGDGIHLTDPAGMDDVRANVVGTSIIDRIDQQHAPDTQYLEHVIINFGGRPTEIIGEYGNIDVGAYTSDKLVNTDFTNITNGSSITASGGAANLDGRVISTDITPSITNSGIARRGIYGGTVTLDFSNAGLDPTALYTVRFTASRNSNTGDRWGEVTVNETMQEINAEANPPTVLEWTNVNGGMLAGTGLVSTKRAGSTQMYMNGLEIIKQ